MGHLDAAQDQFAAFLEGMDVIAQSDAGQQVPVNHTFKTHQVLRNSQFDIVFRPFDDRDRMASLFEQGGIIGAGVTMGAVKFEQGTEAETLRGLGAPQPVTRDGINDDAVFGLLDRVDDGDGRDHALMGFQGVDDVLHDFGRDAGAGAIMDQHQIGRFGQFGQGFEAVTHAVMAFRATADGGRISSPSRLSASRGSSPTGRSTSTCGRRASAARRMTGLPRSIRNCLKNFPALRGGVKAPATTGSKKEGSDTHGEEWAGTAGTSSLCDCSPACPCGPPTAGQCTSVLSWGLSRLKTGMLTSKRWPERGSTMW